MTLPLVAVVAWLGQLGATAAVPAPDPMAAPPSAATSPAPVTAVTEPPPAVWSVPLLHGAGVLGGMRLGLSLIWPEPYDPRPFARSGASFRRAYTEPPEYNRRRSLIESDNDPWYVNTIGHGLFGAEIYGRARQCGVKPLPSFVFAVGTSALWEFGIESFNKPPSAIDLIATPIMGMAIGEARVQLQRWLRAGKRSGWTKFWEVVIDPLGEAERGWLRTRC